MTVNTQNASLEWAPSDDGFGSGIYGYRCVIDNSAVSNPVGLPNQSLPSSITFSSGSGNYYIHVFASDNNSNVGGRNYTPTYHYGPIKYAVPKECKFEDDWTPSGNTLNYGILDCHLPGGTKTIFWNGANVGTFTGNCYDMFGNVNPVVRVTSGGYKYSVGAKVIEGGVSYNEACRESA